MAQRARGGRRRVGVPSSTGRPPLHFIHSSLLLFPESSTQHAKQSSISSCLSAKPSNSAHAEHSNAAARARAVSTHVCGSAHRFGLQSRTIRKAFGAAVGLARCRRRSSDRRKRQRQTHARQEKHQNHYHYQRSKKTSGSNKSQLFFDCAG